MSIETQKLIKQKNKGFTLIEMVIVILLVGIMAAIAIPKFVNLTSAAKQAAYDQGLGSLKSATSIYLGQWQGNWPSGDSLVAAMEGTVTCAVVNGMNQINITDVVGTYLFTPATCATAMTALSDIAIWTSSF